MHLSCNYPKSMLFFEEHGSPETTSQVAAMPVPVQYAEKLDEGKRKRLDDILKGARAGPAAGAASSGAPPPRQEVF